MPGPKIYPIWRGGGSLLIGIHAWSQLSLHVRVVTAPPGTHIHLPHPHQLAYGQDGQLKGFAVLEYETAEMAEEVQQEADGLALGGSHLRISFCAPGPPGRSMLAALIAAQATVSVCPRSGNGKLGRPGSPPLRNQGSWRSPLRFWGQ